MQALPQRTKVVVDKLIEIDNELKELQIRLENIGVRPTGIPTTRAAIKEHIGLLYIRAANEMSEK